MLKARSPLKGAVLQELQEVQRTLSFFWELLYSWSSCSWSPPEVNFSCFAAFSVLHPVLPWCLLWFWASALAFWLHLGLVSSPWICGVNAGLCLVLVDFTGLVCTPASGKVGKPWMVSVQALPALLTTSAPSSSPENDGTLSSAWQAVYLAEIFSLSLISYLLFQMQQIISRCLEIPIWVQLPS